MHIVEHKQDIMNDERGEKTNILTFTDYLKLYRVRHPFSLKLEINLKYESTIEYTSYAIIITRICHK